MTAVTFSVAVFQPHFIIDLQEFWYVVVQKVFSAHDYPIEFRMGVLKRFQMINSYSYISDGSGPIFTS